MGEARAKHELDAHAWPSGEFAIGCNFVGNRSLTQKDHRGSPNIWKGRVQQHATPSGWSYNI